MKPEDAIKKYLNAMMEINHEYMEPCEIRELREAIKFCKTHDLSTAKEFQPFTWGQDNGGNIYCISNTTNHMYYFYKQYGLGVRNYKTQMIACYKECNKAEHFFNNEYDDIGGPVYVGMLFEAETNGEQIVSFHKFEELIEDFERKEAN